MLYRNSHPVHIVIKSKQKMMKVFPKRSYIIIIIII